MFFDAVAQRSFGLTNVDLITPFAWIVINQTSLFLVQRRDKDSEIKHVKSTLKRCGYQERSFKRVCVKKNISASKNQDANSDTKKQNQCCHPLCSRVV